MDLITITIAVIAIATSFLVTLLLERFGGRKRIKEIQTEINKINKEYREAVKNKDEKRIAELEVKLKDFPKLMMESTVLSLKGMVIMLPVILIVPYVVRAAFPDFIIELPFQLPVPFRNDKLIDMRDTFGSYGWFWISFIILGGVSQLIYTRLKPKQQDKQQEQQQDKRLEQQQDKRLEQQQERQA